MANRAIVIAGLATVSPEEHSLIIRDVPPDERDQFRIYWLGRQNGLAVPYVPGMRSEANHMRILTDGA